MPVIRKHIQHWVVNLGNMHHEGALPILYCSDEYLYTRLDNAYQTPSKVVKLFRQKKALD